MAAERDRLIEQHLSLVQAIAGKLKRNLGRSIDFEDLVGYGSKGLIEAADRFDARQGTAFTTFAYYRIRGAMLDGLRTMGWYSRADYARYRAEERANEYLKNRADREGSARAESPAAPGAGAKPDTGQTLASVAEVLSGIATVHITSIEAASRGADERLPSPARPPANLLPRRPGRARARRGGAAPGAPAERPCAGGGVPPARRDGRGAAGRRRGAARANARRRAPGRDLAGGGRARQDVLA